VSLASKLATVRLIFHVRARQASIPIYLSRQQKYLKHISIGDWAKSQVKHVANAHMEMWPSRSHCYWRAMVVVCETLNLFWSFTNGSASL